MPRNTPAPRPSALRREPGASAQDSPEALAAKKKHESLNQLHNALFERIKDSRKDALKNSALSDVQSAGEEQERRGMTLVYEHFKLDFYSYTSGSFCATVTVPPKDPANKEDKLSIDKKLNLGFDEWAKVAADVVENSGGSKDKFILESVEPESKADYLIAQLKKCGFKEVEYQGKSHKADVDTRDAEVALRSEGSADEDEDEYESPRLGT